MKYVGAMLLCSLFLLIGCNSQKQIKYGKKYLEGNWGVQTAEAINSNLGDDSVVPIGKINLSDYGFGKISFQPNNAYVSSITVLKDIVVKRKIFGNEINQTIIKAKYTSVRIGTYSATDTSIILYDHNRDIITEGSYYFAADYLIYRTVDNNRNLWISRWKKIESF